MGNYHVAFKGEIADGHSMEDVRARFAESLKADGAAIDRLFSGKPFNLTKGLDWEQALSAASRLRAIGAIVYLVDGDGKAVESPPPANDEIVDPHDLTATAKVRHLTQLTSTQAHRETPREGSRKAQMRYRFDSFMAKGGSSIFKVLTAVFLGTFLLIGLMRGALLMLYPDLAAQHEELGVLGNFYITFLEITDPGNMA